MIEQYIQERIAVSHKILADKETINALKAGAEMLVGCLKKGGKILIAGNGGSAADAQHFAAELVGRYVRDRKGLAAIALTVDTSILTAWANDYSFDTVFARQVEALGKPGDALVGISTSGNSKNIVKAIEEARGKGMSAICLLGRDGGAMKGLADCEILIPADATSHIQEAHIMVIHILCAEIEMALFG